MVSLDDLNDDVLWIICSHMQDGRDRVALKSLSSTNRRFRSLTGNLIFRKLAISGNWAAAKRGLRVVENCPAALEHARSFSFDISIDYEKRPQPSAGLEQQLVKVLSAMAKLENLKLVIPEWHTDIFAQAFQGASLQMPTVTQLTVGPYCGFAIQRTPNVEALSYTGMLVGSPVRSVKGKKDYRTAQHDIDLIRQAGAAKKLKAFEMRSKWTFSEMNEVQWSVPQLRRLGMPEGMEVRWLLWGLLHRLERFPDLEELILPDVYVLNFRMDEITKKQEKKIEERAAGYVFGVCHRLRWLWLGNWRRAEVVRGVDGGVAGITWRQGKREMPYGLYP